MYSQKDVELIDKNIDNIIDSIEEKKLTIFEPTKEEIMKVNKIIMDYIKNNKRKIYGGFSQNKVIMNKNPDDAFYKDTDIPDIDFYSPEPLIDLVNICNILHKEGFKFIEGKEAQHKETYTIFVNFAIACDISYVPRNIYNKIPFITIDEINYTHPYFMYIDLYRMMTEPYFSSFRWKKIFPRLYKLQKHYPFKKIDSPLNDAYTVPNKMKTELEKINKLILDEIKNKDNFIVFGQYAYNCYLKESEYKKYKQIVSPFMQLISTNYIPDTEAFIKLLKNHYPDKITYREFYPLWQFTGYSIVIYYDNFPILHITSNNDKCIPTKICNSIQIGSFDFIFLMNLVGWLRVKVNEIENKIQYHNIMTSHLIEMREYYFKKHKKTLLDDTLFQSFIPTCTGPAYDPARETLLLRNQKKQEGKLVVFRYNPEDPKEAPDYRFANTSGNEISKSGNLKIHL